MHIIYTQRIKGNSSRFYETAEMSTLTRRVWLPNWIQSRNKEANTDGLSWWLPHPSCVPTPPETVHLMEYWASTPVTASQIRVHTNCCWKWNSLYSKVGLKEWKASQLMFNLMRGTRTSSVYMMDAYFWEAESLFPCNSIITWSMSYTKLIQEWRSWPVSTCGGQE